MHRSYFFIEKQKYFVCSSRKIIRKSHKILKISRNPKIEIAKTNMRPIKDKNMLNVFEAQAMLLAISGLRKLRNSVGKSSIYPDILV